MTTLEMSDLFDILYNNITSNLAPGLDEYEKSVFLTKALDEILKAYFNPKGNKFFEGFDDNPRRLIDFSTIVTARSYENFETAHFDTRINSRGISLPTDIMMIINEQLEVKRNDRTQILLLVIPLTYIEYTRLMSKPFKRPSHYQAWRLSNSSGASNIADLIVGPSDKVTKYMIRYIRRPKPIILSDLDTVSINGFTTLLGCELDPILHPEILLRAIEFAKAAYIGNAEPNSNLASIVSLGNNSATNIGVMTGGNKD